MIRVHADGLQLTLLRAGTVWLDGGAMFGVVPRVLWSRERPPDERNRIRLALNVLLVEDGARRILVDTGAGTRWEAKGRDIYGIDAPPPEVWLEPAGIGPEEVDLVINTHLHFDHAGGNTLLGPGGRVVPAFPNARYVVQRGELETARWDHERIRASYRPDDYEPLAREPGRLWLVEGNVPLSRHLQLRLAPGHTPHMQIVAVQTRERRVLFLADLVPTASHLPLPYIMAYDLEPLATLATKRRVLAEAVRAGWEVIFEHDDTLPWGRLEEGPRGRLQARPVEPS